MIAGRPTAASPRAVSVRLSITGLIFVRGDFAVAAVALSECFQGAAIFFLVEVRPVGGRDIPFRICSLPDEEIAHTQLSRSTNDEVRIRHAGRVQVATDRLVADVPGGNAVFHDILNRIDD